MVKAFFISVFLSVIDLEPFLNSLVMSFFIGDPFVVVYVNLFLLFCKENLVTGTSQAISDLISYALTIHSSGMGKNMSEKDLDL